VFGVTAASRNTRFQAACWALPGPDLHRLITPACLAPSLMVITFAIVLMVIVDQTQFHGRFGAQFARLIVAALAQVGL
jgi:hypothetical protein